MDTWRWLKVHMKSMPGQGGEESARVSVWMRRGSVHKADGCPTYWQALPHPRTPTAAGATPLGAPQSPYRRHALHTILLVTPHPPFPPPPPKHQMDVAQVKHFQRRILDFRIEAAGTASGGRRLFLLSLRGTAFLWHQVRCMAAVLLMVGRGKEDPGVVAALLDVGRHPAKPLYGLASEEPLLLSGCRYAPGELRFLRTEANRDQVCKVLGRALDRCAGVAGTGWCER